MEKHRKIPRVYSTSSPTELARQLGVSKQRAYHLLQPEKFRARQAVSRAIKNGKLVRPEKCEICAKTQCLIQAHHDDYSKPLNVKWVCSSCHLIIHPHGAPTIKGYRQLQKLRKK